MTANDNNVAPASSSREEPFGPCDAPPAPARKKVTSAGCAAALRAALAGGPRPVVDIEALLRDLGFGGKARRKARELVKTESYRAGALWMMRLGSAAEHDEGAGGSAIGQLAPALNPHLELESPCPDCVNGLVHNSAAWDEWRKQRAAGLQTTPPFHPETRRCATCQGRGAIPTALGQRIIDFVRRHVR